MSAPRSSDEAVPSAVWRIAAVVVFGAFMAGLNTSLVNVGLNTIARDLHARLADSQWVSSGYLLALAAALPACPWLQRRFGANRVWIVAIAGFTVTSALCAMAPNLPLLLAARVLQGMSGGILVPAGQSVLARAAGSERMGRVMSTTGIPVVLAPAIGPAIGGVLIAALDWRWLFWINIPIGIVAVILGLRGLPHSPVDRHAPLDLVGLVLIAAGLPTLSYGIIRVGDAAAADLLGIASAVIGLGLLVAFVARGRARQRQSRPVLLDLRLFAQARYTLAQVTVLFTGVSLFGGLILLPLYYEVLRHHSVIETGLLLLAYGAGATAVLRLGGNITDRLGGGISCSIGLVITVFSTVPFVVLPADANIVLVEALQFVRGVGVGLAGLPAMSSAFSAAPDRIEDATTTANIMQRVGGSIGSAVLVVIISRSGPDATSNFQLAFGALTLGAVLALVAAILLTFAQRKPANS